MTSSISASCRLTGRSFFITPLEQRILATLDLPLPTLSPLERHRRRLAHRNEDSLYVRQCDRTGERMVSIYPEGAPYVVYSQAAWWSDAWHGSDYGTDVDLSRPFFEQFAELQRRVPRMGLMNGRGENSEYCHNCVELKNCYMVFGGDYVQDSLYSFYNDDSRDVVDVYRVKKSELVYDSTDCSGCYNVKYCENTHGCRDSAFLSDCHACSDCCGCVGLRHARFCLFNQQLSETEYRRKLHELRLDRWSGVEQARARFQELVRSTPRRAAWQVQCEQCTGNRLTQAKSCLNCFDIGGPAEDLANVYSCGSEVRDVASSNNLGKAEQLYEVMSGVESTGCACSLYAWSSSNVFYSDTAISCRDVFGCVSLRGARQAIFNKSYTVHEYERLRARLVAHMRETGEWGEFFPIELSPFAYNETLAYTFFPLTEPQVAERGWRWAEKEERVSDQATTLPDSIHDAGDDVVGSVVVCEQTGKPYRLIAKEIEFYRKMGVPIPRICFAARTRRKLDGRGGIELFGRRCSGCAAEVDSPYPEERFPAVLCAACAERRI